MSILLTLFVAVQPLPPGTFQAGSGNRAQVLEMFRRLAPAAQWRLIRRTRLRFRTYHPQGLVKVGERYLLSSVEVLERPASARASEAEVGGLGHLFEFDASGRLSRQTTLGDSGCYHPGGIDFDGRFVWIPVAEYRPDSRTVVYRLDPTDFGVSEVFRVSDHIGGLSVDRLAGRIHGVSWGSRRFFTWDLSGTLVQVTVNPSLYIDYQDCKFAGSGLMLCSGLKTYRGPDGQRFTLGGVEIVGLELPGPMAQVPVPLFAPDGSVMTRNPFFFELRDRAISFFFIPEDEQSWLYEWAAPLRDDDEPQDPEER